MFLMLLRYLRGYVQFNGEGDFPERFMNIVGRQGIIMWDVRRTETGISAKISARSYKMLRPAAQKTELALQIIKKCGLPFVIKKYRRRYGLAAGLIMFAAVIYICSLFIWTVDIQNDTQTVTDEDIRRAAWNAGVRPGALLSKLDSGGAEIDILLSLEELSWVAVNTGSSRISVLVKERTPVPEMDNSEEICNLKASKDGQIVSLNILEGKNCVKVGDTVAAGDLLASGVIDIELGGTRTVHAKGTVTAMTVNRFSAEVPIDYTLRERTGKKTEKCRLYLFNKAIKMYFGKEPEFLHDLETDVQYLELLGTRLPFGIEKKTFYEVREAPAKHSREQAELLAEKEARLRAQDELLGIEVISESSRVVMTDNSVIFELEVSCLENIAYEEPVDFE